MNSLLDYSILLFLLLVASIIANEGPLEYPEPIGGWPHDYCNSTKIQSPIDIPSTKDDSVLIDDGSHAKIISLLYSNINQGIVYYDKGHKWTTDALNVGILEIEINGTLFRYNLSSFHFHLYSEHRIENKQYPMELHFVHTNLDENDEANKHLVIGILFDYKDDKENKFLKDINLGDETPIKEASIFDLINKDDTFYYYKGSLTTPSCTEIVNWIVFKDIRSMSYEQFNKFRDWVEHSNMTSYGTGYGNARGPKRLNKREIYLENYKEEKQPDDESSSRLSTGQILRQTIANQKIQNWENVQKRMNEGKLVDSDIVLKLLSDEMDKQKEKHIILDGFPINEENFEAWEKNIKEKLHAIFYLEITEDEMKKRLIRRGEREDDNENAIKERIRAFNYETKPLINYLRNKGNIIIFDGMKSKKELNAELKSEIMNKKLYK